MEKPGKAKTRAKINVESGAKRVRAFINGTVIADSLSPLLVWEHRFHPQYYFPESDVLSEYLVANGSTKEIPGLGVAHYFDLVVAERSIPGAAWTFPESDVEQIRGAFRFEWAEIDSWFEEDEEVFGHPRDPYTRIDILNSTRHVEVVVNGFLVADSHSPRMLHETGSPTRYYLPKTDIRMDLLRTSETVTYCPYKGTANSLSMEVDGVVIKNIAWTYIHPLPESQKIAGLVCFYNEKVDIHIDGVLQQAARSPF